MERVAWPARNVENKANIDNVLANAMQIPSKTAWKNMVKFKQVRPSLRAGVGVDGKPKAK